MRGTALWGAKFGCGRLKEGSDGLAPFCWALKLNPGREEKLADPGRRDGAKLLFADPGKGVLVVVATPVLSCGAGRTGAGGGGLVALGATSLREEFIDSVSFTPPFSTGRDEGAFGEVCAMVACAKLL